MSKKRKKNPKQWEEMTTAELAEATAEFEEEFVADTFGPPKPGQAEQLRRAKRKRGRPKVGQGIKRISVSVEKGLLGKTDRLARQLKMRRAQLIARGLQAIVDREISVET